MAKMKQSVNKQKTNHGKDSKVPFAALNSFAGKKKGGKVDKLMPKPEGAGPDTLGNLNMKKGGKVKKYARGGGIEIRGKTRGKIC